MAITLNGTTGITTPAEAAGDISYTGTLTGGTGIVNLGSGQVYKDASGNVGIGTTTPGVNTGSKLSVVGAGIYTNGGYALTSDGSYFTPSGASFAIPNYGLGQPYTSFVSVSGFSGIPFYTNQVERARIDSSGNLGIGTSSPASKLQVVGGDQVIRSLRDTGTGGLSNGDYGGRIAFGTSAGAGTGYIGGQIGIVADGSWTAGSSQPSILAFYNVASGSTALTERARIDSSGNLLVGTATSVLATARATFQTASGAGVVSATNTSVNYFCVNTNNTSWDAISFRYNTSTEVGRIACTSTATSYVTGSDYRLKEAIAPMTGALAKVALLKPCTYKWKVDGSDGQGFIAHELAEVEPGCVTGEKDAVDAEGKPQYQGVDTSFLVATLTAAIQEQQAIITALTARITALETK